MGFFGRLFQRKRGGTRVGNAIRRYVVEHSFGLVKMEDIAPDPIDSGSTGDGSDNWSGGNVGGAFGGW